MSNDVQIAEHVAFLLLVRDSWDLLRQSDQDLSLVLNRFHQALINAHASLSIPSPPTLDKYRLLNVLDALEAALDASPHASTIGTFFQREIRFELLKAGHPTQYPTPHHIAALMADLSMLSSSKRVLDPVAGTAGLLVASANIDNDVTVVGIDFVPESVALGSTNLILNKVPHAQMQMGDALDILASRDNQELFDNILFNPPFGSVWRTRGSYEYEWSRFGSNPATLLAAQTLQRLTANGIAAFLQPTSLLFGKGGEAQLREILIKEVALESVITLPPHAMQPYNQVATHLVVVQKTIPKESIWFLELTHDGYASGTARDLTDEPDPARNELPRARELVLRTRDNQQWVQQLQFDDREVQSIRVGRELKGLAVRLLGDTQSIKWRAIHRTEGLIVTITDAAGALKGWFYESYAAENAPIPLRFVTSAAVPLNWTDKLVCPDWKIGSETLQGSSDDITLNVDATKRTFTLSTNIKFEAEPQENAVAFACLLNTEGQPITPWLSTTDSKFDTDKFGRNLQSSIVQDAYGQRLGWLLDVTSGQGVDEKQATLFVVLAPENSVYHSDNGTFYALLSNGWIEISADGRLQLQTGTPVRLRDDFIPQGFAVGPSPENDNAAYCLFGVLVQREILIVDGKVGDMRPSRFLPEPEAAPLGHPLDVLASIRRSQVELADKVDTLLGILGHPGQYSEEAELPAEVPTWIEAVLGSEQKQLRALLTQRLAGQKPRHFTQADLIEWCKLDLPTFAGDDVQQQMTLFVRLGLVKEVNIDGKNYYRMITRGDVAQPAGESS